MRKFYFLFIISFMLNPNIFAQKKAAPNSVSSFYSYLTSVYFVSANNGWAVGDKGVILNTTDGGTSWSLQPSGTTNWLNSVFFIDKNNGFAVGQNGTILKTSNGGKNWVQQQSNTSNDLEDVFFTNKENGIAVGFYKILKTTNGGIDWTSVSSDAVVWNSICFTDANNGWIAGSGGAIWKTTDGGSNWKHLYEYNQYSVAWFNDISFVDNNNGLAVDDFYGIHKTTDGGITWNISYNSGGSSNILYSIFYYNVNIAFAVGYINNNSTILKTTDGGTTWLSQTSGTNDLLRSVYFTDLNNGIIVSSSGKILKTTNGGANWIDKTNILGTPILLSPVNDSLGIELSAILSWNDEIFNADSYQLQISIDSNFTSLFFNDSTIINQSEYYENKSLKINNLSEGTLYYWRVRDKINNVYGPWSNVWKFTTIGKTAYLKFPLNNSVLSPINISLQWSNTTETTEYRVQVSTDSIFESIVLDKDKITGNSITVNLNYNTKYYWRVGAKNIDGQTYWSDYRSFRTKPSPRTTFPLNIGNKWYYQAGFNQRGYYYGVVKQITDTLSNGYKEVTCTYYYRDSITTGKEYWAYTDGKFYINSSPTYGEYFYDSYLSGDTCNNDGFTTICRQLISYNIFNISDTAQYYSNYFRYHGAVGLETTIFPQVGIIKTYNWHSSTYTSIIKQDSTYLVGLLRNGEVLGDTILQAPLDTATAYFPLNIGQTWIYHMYYPNNDYNEKVVRKVINILDNGFREITATYFLKDSVTEKKEYWFYSEGKFYYSYTPDISTALICYDANLKDEECNSESDGDHCIFWLANNYSFNNKEYKAQYYSIAYPATSPSKEITTADGLGPVKFRYITVPNGWSTGPTEELIDMKLDTTSTTELISNPLIPQNNSSEISVTTFLKWKKIANALSYRIQISNDSTFKKIFKEYSGMKDTTLKIDSLDFSSKYYWRVETLGITNDSINYSFWSQVWSFTTIALPTEYKLYQNYPNPFNPTTKIEYDLPHSGHVQIKIYDILGREITTLLNEEKPAGRYQVKFNGSRYVSGVYFYRIQAGNYSSVKKMVLMK